MVEISFVGSIISTWQIDVSTRDSWRSFQKFSKIKSDFTRDLTLVHGVGYNYEDVEDDDDLDDDVDDDVKVDDDDDNGVGDDDVCVQELLTLLTGLLVSPGLLIIKLDF